MKEYLVASLILFGLAYVQNVSFSIVSRSRNRSSVLFHLIASFFSNSLWFFTMKMLITKDMSLSQWPWYCAATMLGAISGVWISMKIEKWLHAESDAHLKPKINVEDLERIIKALEMAKVVKLNVVDTRRFQTRMENGSRQ